MVNRYLADLFCRDAQTRMSSSDIRHPDRDQVGSRYGHPSVRDGFRTQSRHAQQTLNYGTHNRLSFRLPRWVSNAACSTRKAVRLAVTSTQYYKHDRMIPPATMGSQCNKLYLEIRSWQSPCRPRRLPHSPTASTTNLHSTCRNGSAVHHAALNAA